MFVKDAGITLSHLRDESGRNVLHRAVLAGNPEALKYFMAHGKMDIDEPTPTGKTAIDLCKASLASESTRKELMDILQGTR